MKLTWLVFNPIAKIILLPRYTRRYKLRMIYNYIKLEVKELVYRHRRNKKTRINILGYEIHGHSYMSLVMLFREIFIEEQYFFIAENDNPVIFDCGANIGLTSIYFKILYPNCHIFAFEPDEKNYELYKNNIKNNNLKNVEIINAAISDREGKIEYFYDPNVPEAISNSIEYELMPGSKKLVDSLLLSSFIGDRQIDFAKMDVEGAERRIITDLIRNNKLLNIKEYVIEYHHLSNDPRYSISDFLSQFERNNYNCLIKSDYDKKSLFWVLLLRFYQN